MLLTGLVLVALKATHRTLWDRLGGTPGSIGTIAGAIVAAAAVVGLARAAFRRTVGRRWTAQRRISRLAGGVQVAYFTSILGEPAIRRRGGAWTVFVFVDRLFYVHVLADPADDSVAQFAVTTRSRRFHPKIKWWTVNSYKRVRLGKTSFAAFGHVPEAINGTLGAHNFGYSELYYFGNPSNYQHYVLAINDAGAWEGVDVDAFSSFLARESAPDVQLDSAGAQELVESDAGQRFRGTAPNTYAVTAPSQLPVLNSWCSVGVDVNDVRVIPA